MKNSYPKHVYSQSDFGKLANQDQETAPNEEIIWEKFKSGNKAALTYIYRNYANPLFNYGCQFTENKELVKDAIQDLFIEIINAKGRLGRTDSIKYYLFRSLRNKLVKLLVKKKKESQQGQHLPDAFQVSLSPEVMLINQQVDHERRQLITQKLNELPPLQREALLLLFYEGMSYEQIAGVLGVKVKSARELIYRATRSMSKLLLPIKDRVV